jgi:hypothetical protein
LPIFSALQQSNNTIFKSYEGYVTHSEAIGDESVTDRTGSRFAAHQLGLLYTNNTLLTRLSLPDLHYRRLK